MCREERPALADVRNVALETVCTLFCTNQTEVPLKFGYLSHVVRAVSAALRSQMRSTISIVIRKTKYIFSLDYRGLLTLMPLYLAQIQDILAVDSPYEDRVKSAAMTILGSLLCLPDRFPRHEVASAVKGAPKVGMLDMKRQIQGILCTFIESFKTNKSAEKIMLKAICCANIMIYQEAANPDRQADTLHVLLCITLELHSTHPSIFAKQLHRHC